MGKTISKLTKRLLKGVTILAIALFIGVFFVSGNAQAKVKYYKIKGCWVGFDKSKAKITWHGGLSYIPKKVAGKKVKIIGRAAFCNNKKLKTAKIPSSVKKIERYAFGGCPNLKKVVFPKGFKMKKGYVRDKLIFWDSNQLKTVVNNPDKKWAQEIKSFKTLEEYLNKKGAKYYLDNVREAKNQWVPDETGDDRHDYTDEEWNTVVKKAEELTKGCTSAREKAKKISKWIEKNIEYDTVWMKRFKEWRKTHDPDKEKFPLKKYTDAYNLITWNKSDQDGKRRTTCGGYANTTQAMFAAVGIPCVHVRRDQAADEDIDHVFNAAYIGGKWIWIDNTYTDASLNYFDCQIAGFAASDHRCDQLNLDYISNLLKTTNMAANKTGANKTAHLAKNGLLSLLQWHDTSEQVNVDGKQWLIDRASGRIDRFPQGWTGPEIPSEIDGMKVKSIDSYACTYRGDIRELIIPEGITKIGEGAFRGCSRLEKLTVAKSVKTISDYAFEACDELETINYKGNKKKIKFGNYAFADDFFLHPDFSTAYKKGIYYKRLHEVELTGDFAKDMVAVAKSQVGYHHGNNADQMHGYNKLGGEYYAEYNYFTGSPDWQWGMKGLVKETDYKWGYGGWCGNFCEWCIALAGVPSECTTRKNIVKWKDTVYAGGSYEIKAGDVMHFSAGHYCLVTSVTVSGNKVKIKTLNGNPDVSWKTYSLNKKDGKNSESHNYDFDEVYPLDVSKKADVKTFTVSFDNDGGTGGFASKTVYEGAFFGLLPKPTKSGYKFSGWYTGKNGTGKMITSYRNVWLDGDLTVYANWEEGSEPGYMDINSYKSKAPKHSSIDSRFARIYIEKSSFSYKDLKKKAQKTKIKKKNGKGKMTFKNVTTGSKKKYIKVSKKGIVTIKKGAPKGTYAVHVKVAKWKTVNMSQATMYITVN